MKCLYCKLEFNPNDSDFCQKYEGCPECEKKYKASTEQLAKTIASMPVELRRALSCDMEDTK